MSQKDDTKQDEEPSIESRVRAGQKEVLRVELGKLFDDENNLWLERSGRPADTSVAKEVHKHWNKAAPILFKMRYKVGGKNKSSALTRWFGTTLMTDYEMRRRDVQLGQGDDAPGRSPMTVVRVAAAVAAALLLLALVGFGVLLAVRLGCPTGGVDSASTAPAVAPAAAVGADADAAAYARACVNLSEVKVWTNCSRACPLSDGYPKPGEKLPADNNCTRVLWKACYGLDACWPTPTDPNVPPTLECFFGDSYHEHLYGELDKADSCAAKSSYCYAFAPYEGGKVYYGCYAGGAKTTKIVPANKTVGCGKNIGNYSCALVAADLVGLSGKFVGQLCCCHGNRCDVNKTLAQRAIDEMQANSTCEGANKSGDKDDVRSLDGASTGLQQCERGGLCIDSASQDAATKEYSHARGCDFGGVDFNKVLHGECAKQLGLADRTCFTADMIGRNRSVCCCRGSNCSADNALEHRYPSATTTRATIDGACTLTYELVDGAPNHVVGGPIESGCVTDLTRVPPAAVAAACFRYGCFATHDVDGANVSLCCCRGVGCAPAHVRAFVANRAAPTPPTPPPSMAPSTLSTASTSTSAEETSAPVEKEAETASDCGWALWAAVACLLLGLLLVAPVLAVGLYLIYQFTWANEYVRWEHLQDFHKPRDEWDDGFGAHAEECVRAFTHIDWA